MRNTPFNGGPKFDPQLHLFDNKNNSIQNKADNTNNQKKLPPVEITPEDLNFEDMRNDLIAKYKIGYEAQDHLTFKKEEKDPNDDKKGWYVKNQTLTEWVNFWENIEKDDDNYEHPWQRVHNK